MTSLAIFTTHPIQYQAPWFRALAAEQGLDVEVVFSYLPEAAEQGIGFGTAIKWDIPLVSGYRYRILKTTVLAKHLPGMARRWAHGISSVLQEMRPDVAMVLGWQEISLVQALLACRRKGIPIVLRGESNAFRRRSVAVAMLHRQYFRLCDAFLAIGRANADLYRAAGVLESRIVTAGYFVENERFSVSAESLRGERDAIRQTWAIARGTTCFAFVGKLEAKKCVMDYLEGLRVARDSGTAVSGLVVGSGVQLEEMRRYVAEKSLPVTFAGFLNQSEIARAYVAADALVLPSDYGETWGLVVNEAMATGLPAIVSDRIGAANDLVLDGCTGLVVPHGNSSAIASAMVRLASDQEARERMGGEARARVCRYYSIPRAVVATRQVLAQVLRQRHATA